MSGPVIIRLVTREDVFFAVPINLMAIEGDHLLFVCLSSTIPSPPEIFRVQYSVVFCQCS